MFIIRKDFLIFLFLACWAGFGEDACTGLSMLLNVELERSACGSSDGIEDIDDRGSETE